jgi:hypothetical protein
MELAAVVTENRADDEPRAVALATGHASAVPAPRTLEEKIAAHAWNDKPGSRPVGNRRMIATDGTKLEKLLAKPFIGGEK